MSVRHGWWKKVAAEARAAVKEAAESHAGHPAVLAFILGNEITDPVARWHARRRVDHLLRSLFETDKVAAPKALFSYANYPSTQYLDTSCFDCFNVFLENESAYQICGPASGLDQRPAPSLDRAGFGVGRRGAPASRLPRLVNSGAMELGLAGTCVLTHQWLSAWRVRLGTDPRVGVLARAPLEIGGFDPEVGGPTLQYPGPSLHPSLAPMQGPRERVLAAAARLR
jgi:hypothetical protein